MYLSCAQRTDIATNKSYIDWTLTVTGGTSSYYQTGPTTVTINGVQVYYMRQVAWDERIFPAARGSTSGTIEVPHDEYGNKTIACSIATSIYTGIVKTTTGSWTLDSIPRKATITSAPDFTDEENPTIQYSNPAGTAVDSLQACISFTGAVADIAYRDIPKTGSSYTFSLSKAERDVLRNGTKDSNSRTVRFIVKTVIGGVTYGDGVPKTLSIVNATPVVTASIFDTNTGVSNKAGTDVLVRYLSCPRITVDYDLKKGATLKSFSVKNGENYKYGNPADFAEVTSGTFEISVVDSRGNTPSTHPVVVSKPLVPYVKLSCTLDEASINTEGVLTVRVSGGYYNGTIGKATNTLTLNCRYRQSGTSSWTEAGSITNTKSNNGYSGSKTISGLDYTKTYEVQAYAFDIFSTVDSDIRSVKAYPVFDLGEDDFNLNVPLHMNGSQVLAVTDLTERKVLDALTTDKAKVLRLLDRPVILDMTLTFTAQVPKYTSLFSGSGILGGLPANLIAKDATGVYEIQVRETLVQTLSVFPAGTYNFYCLLLQ